LLATAPHSLGRLDRRVSHHQGHPARIRAEVHRRQVGVAGHAADVERIDAKHLGDERDQHVVRALADLGATAEDRHAARAVELNLHAGVRHLVPVDRESRARQVRAAGQAEALTGWELAEAVLPVGQLHDATDALGQTDAADLHVVRGGRPRLLDDLQPQIGRVDQ